MCIQQRYDKYDIKNKNKKISNRTNLPGACTQRTLPEQQSNNREILSLFRPSWTKWSRREGIKCGSLCV